MLDKQEPQSCAHTRSARWCHACASEKLTAAEINALLPLLDGDDEAGVLRPVIHLLEDQSFDRSYLAQLNRLADSPQPLVKRFAVQKLGGFDSGAVVKTLIGYLTDDSYARRDQAAASLKNLPARARALMKELLDCDDERKAWTIADILLVHERDWKRDTREALWKKLEAALENREDRLYTAYFHFLNALDADALGAQVCARADALRKKKDFADRAKWLALLKDSPASMRRRRFALAVAELKAHRQAWPPVLRRHDPALELLARAAALAVPSSPSGCAKSACCCAGGALLHRLQLRRGRQRGKGTGARAARARSPPIRPHQGRQGREEQAAAAGGVSRGLAVRLTHVRSGRSPSPSRSASKLRTLTLILSFANTNLLQLPHPHPLPR